MIKLNSETQRQLTEITFYIREPNAICPITESSLGVRLSFNNKKDITHYEKFDKLTSDDIHKWCKNLLKQIFETKEMLNNE